MPTRFYAKDSGKYVGTRRYAGYRYYCTATEWFAKDRSEIVQRAYGEAFRDRCKMERLLSDADFDHWVRTAVDLVDSIVETTIEIIPEGERR